MANGKKSVKLRGRERGRSGWGGEGGGGGEIGSGRACMFV